MRKPRSENRTPEQKLEDSFCDLTVIQQAAVLNTLASLHRWARRMQERAATGDEAEAAGRADYEASGKASGKPNTHDLLGSPGLDALIKAATGYDRESLKDGLDDPRHNAALSLEDAE